MSGSAQLLIFGEVLFDCFPGGERILGGAPFNVAWHLQALGAQPLLISRVGTDEPGREILAAIRHWGMSEAGVQLDSDHPTGRVDVELVDHEPSYRIVPDCAYDFIAAAELPACRGGILYHGTLALRNAASRAAFDTLAEQPALNIFLDVNLRAPWWRQAEVYGWLERARWVKLNQEELGLLGFAGADLRVALTRFLERFALEQVILTCGEEGALVQTATGEVHQIVPRRTEQFVDTVGAGDAFTAVYLHGLRTARPIPETLQRAQAFASKVLGLRGATTAEQDFYREFLED